MNNRLKIVSVLVAFILVCAVLCSSAYISLNQEHACTGSDCPICMELEVARQAIQNVRIVPVADAFFIFLCTFVQTYMAFSNHNDVSDTLITLKVMLLN